MDAVHKIIDALMVAVAIMLAVIFVVALAVAYIEISSYVLCYAGSFCGYCCCGYDYFS